MKLLLLLICLLACAGRVHSACDRERAKVCRDTGLDGDHTCQIAHAMYSTEHAKCTQDAGCCAKLDDFISDPSNSEKCTLMTKCEEGHDQGYEDCDPITARVECQPVLVEGLCRGILMDFNDAFVECYASVGCCDEYDYLVSLFRSEEGLPDLATCDFPECFDVLQDDSSIPSGEWTQRCYSDSDCSGTDGFTCDTDSGECRYTTSDRTAFCLTDASCQDLAQDLDWYGESNLKYHFCSDGQCVFYDGSDYGRCSDDRDCMPQSSCVLLSMEFRYEEMSGYLGEGPHDGKFCVRDLERASCGAEECTWECQTISSPGEDIPDDSDCPESQICTYVQHSCGGDGSFCSEADGPCRCFGTKCVEQTCYFDEDCVDAQGRLQCEQGRCTSNGVAKFEEALNTADLPLNVILVLLTIFEIGLLFKGGTRSITDCSRVLGIYVALNLVAAVGFGLKFLDWPAILEYRDDVDTENVIDVACVGIAVDAGVTIICSFIEIICDLIEHNTSLLTNAERKISVVREFLLIVLQLVQGALWVLRAAGICSSAAYYIVGAGLVTLVIQAGILILRVSQQCRAPKEVVDDTGEDMHVFPSSSDATYPPAPAKPASSSAAEPASALPPPPSSPLNAVFSPSNQMPPPAPATPASSSAAHASAPPPPPSSQPGPSSANFVNISVPQNQHQQPSGSQNSNGNQMGPSHNGMQLPYAPSPYWQGAQVPMYGNPYGW